MSKPNNSINKIKLPGENTGRPIVPYCVSSSNNFVATLPDTLTADAEFIINKLNQAISGEKTFNDGIKIGSDSPGALNTIALYNQSTFEYDYLYGGTDGGYYNFPSFSGNLGIIGDIFIDGGHIKNLEGLTFTLPSSTGTLALTSDIPTNIQNGSTTGSLQQVFDGSTFTFVNPNSPLNNTTVNIGIATGTYATMLGGKGRVEGKRSFVNGTQVVATGSYAHAEGNNTHASGANSHAEGIQTYANGSASHAEGSSTAATETGAHSEGYGTHADGVYTHTEGSTNYALGDNSHAEGGSNIVGVYSGPSPTPTPGPAPEPGTAVHAEGMGSHAEGNNNTITGAYSHAEGQGNTVSSNRAHAEGNGNTVSGLYAHAEGNGGVASGEGAHSEGLYGHAIGNYSHAEGAATYANGLYSHAAGQDSAANGIASFASGYHLAANRDYQTVVGKYNLGQGDTLFEVGKGTAENARSNAFAVYSDGHAEVGLMGSTNLSVATKQYVDSKADNDHYPTTFTWTNGTTSGPTGSLTGNSGFTTVSFGAIPAASSSQSGIITTAAQSFAGAKTFEDDVSVGVASSKAGKIILYGNSSQPMPLSIEAVSSANNKARISVAGGSGNVDIVMGTGRLLSGSSTYGLKIPSTLNYTSDKTLATTEDNYYPSRSFTSGLQISSSTNITNICALYVPYATASQYGVVKVANVRSSTIATTSGGTSTKYQGVEKDSNGKLFVQVAEVSSAIFEEVIPGTVTITFTEYVSSRRTSLTIYDGTDNTGTVLYTKTDSGSIGTQTITVNSGNLFIDVIATSDTQCYSSSSSGGISGIVVTNNYSNHPTLKADVSGDGTLAVTLDFDY